MRIVAVLVVVLGIGAPGVAGAASVAQVPPPVPPPPATTTPQQPVAPAGPSRAIGQPWHGRLVNGVELPEVGPDWLTWDPVLKQIPNRPERRWGTAKLVATLQRVLAGFHAAHPEAPPVLVGDLSRPHGGVFDERYGGLGHSSHQNGLDADVYYPRADRRLLAAYRPELVDRVLAQDLLNRFVADSVQRVFVGTRTGLTGPHKIVQVLAHHNDHMHVRIFPPRG